MRKLDGLALVLVLLFLVSGVLTQGNFGLSWDEGLGNLFFGERYLRYFGSFEEKYLDFKAELYFHSETPLNLYPSPFRDYPNEFPALSDTLSAAAMYLFSYGLKLLDPVDGWHLFTILLAALFLWLFYRFAARRMGRWCAFVGLVLLASFPRFWGDMHFNPKDIPETVFFGLTILAYLAWYEKPTWRKAVGVGLLFACALGTKANALFIPIVLVLGVWPWGFNLRSLGKMFWHPLRHWHHYLVMALISAALYFISWPYLHTNPTRVVEYFRHILSQGERTGNAGWDFEPLLQTLATMPEVMLLLLLVGLFFVARQALRVKSTWWRLLLAWLFIPLLRASLPGVVNFDGIRHFMEYVPAAALIAGYGAAEGVKQLAGRRKRVLKWILNVSVLLLIGLNILQITRTFHPFQHLYYNRIVGGLSGAAKIFGENEATDYWGVSYRQGIDWMNGKAVSGAVLYVPVAEWLVQLPAELWLRPDVALAGHDFADSLRESQQPVYVMMITRPGFYDEIAVHCVENLEPEHQIVVDQRAVLQIYLLDNYYNP
jgi:hypothetical protein